MEAVKMRRRDIIVGAMALLALGALVAYVIISVVQHG
jgi:hypothetical protein